MCVLIDIEDSLGYSKITISIRFLSAQTNVQSSAQLFEREKKLRIALLSLQLIFRFLHYIWDLFLFDQR